MWRTLMITLKAAFSRPLATWSTVFAVAVIVWVFSVLLGIADGVRFLLTSTGQSSNVVILRDGSPTETTSVIDDNRAKSAFALEEASTDSLGHPRVSLERWVFVNEPRRDQGFGNVGFRGIGTVGRDLRPQVRLVSGEWYAPGKRQVVAGRLAAERFQGLSLGEHVRTGNVEWTVVGIFDGGSTAYDSEMWTDEQDHWEAFGQPYASIVVQVPDVSSARTVEGRFKKEPSLQLQAVSESRYFSQQGMLFAMIRLFTFGVTFFLSAGAFFLVMNTMFGVDASLAQKEQGSSSVARLVSSLLVAVLLGIAGAAVGLLCILPFGGMTFGAANWYSFAEYIYKVRFTLPVVEAAIWLAVGIAVLGGILPALQAAFRTRPAS